MFSLQKAVNKHVKLISTDAAQNHPHNMLPLVQLVVGDRRAGRWRQKRELRKWVICRRLIRDLKKSGTLSGIVRNAGGRSKYSKSELAEKNCMQTWRRRFLEEIPYSMVLKECRIGIHRKPGFHSATPPETTCFLSMQCLHLCADKNYKKWNSFRPLNAYLEQCVWKSFIKYKFIKENKQKLYHLWDAKNTFLSLVTLI